MRVDLNQGAYESRSLIAEDQRCVNLFPEENPGDAPFPTIHYPAPGLKRLATAADNVWRALYRVKATGDLYGVCGGSLYYIDRAWVLNLIGSVPNDRKPVAMSDNGFEIMIVAPAWGATVEISSKTFAFITDSAFYGANRVDICDTYFVLDRPGTNNWYISLTNQAVFDSLDIASKTSAPDKLQAVIVMNDNPWLIGELTSEIWYDTGSPDFTFGKMPSVFIEHGTPAPFSVQKYDQSIYWLSQNEQGQYMVMRGNNYAAQRISTHAIEAEISDYGDVSDAIGFCFQMGGHAFYQLTFPTADKTWVWDESVKLWHERVWIDIDGAWHRHRANCAAFAYGQNVCGDWQNGNLYAFDLDTYTDDGAPILYLRTLPHMVNNGSRVSYQRFIADMEVGNLAGTTTDEPPMVSLRWSDDRGSTWGNPVMMPLGSAGQYDTSVQWWQLGVARDRVFEISWSVNVKTSLNGAWLEMIPLRT